VCSKHREGLVLEKCLYPSKGEGGHRPMPPPLKYATVVAASGHARIIRLGTVWYINWRHYSVHLLRFYLNFIIIPCPAGEGESTVIVISFCLYLSMSISLNHMSNLHLFVHAIYCHGSVLLWLPCDTLWCRCVLSAKTIDEFFM